MWTSAALSPFSIDLTLCRANLNITTATCCLNDEYSYWEQKVWAGETGGVRAEEREKTLPWKERKSENNKMKIKDTDAEVHCFCFPCFHPRRQEIKKNQVRGISFLVSPRPLSPSPLLLFAAVFMLKNICMATASMLDLCTVAFWIYIEIEN